MMRIIPGRKWEITGMDSKGRNLWSSTERTEGERDKLEIEYLRGLAARNPHRISPELLSMIRHG